jgi:hypothetical protein
MTSQPYRLADLPDAYAGYENDQGEDESGDPVHLFLADVLLHYRMRRLDGSSENSGL